MLLPLLAAALPLLAPPAQAITKQKVQAWAPPSVFAVADMDRLREMSKPLSGTARVAQVLGYHDPGDGGDGEFYWDATSAKPDDGGTIISPSTNPTKGRWIRLRRGQSVSVAWFGATPDDGTDDFAAIQAAIDFCQKPVGGSGPDFVSAGSLHVPAGVYHVSGTLRILDGIDLHGDDASTTQLLHTGTSDLLRIENLDNDGDGDPDPLYDVSIRRLTLHGNGVQNGQSSNTRFGVYMFHGIRGCSLEDVVVLRCQTGIFLRRCYTANIVGCTVMFCSQHALKWENATAGMISGSRFDVAPNGGHCAFVSFDHTNGEETVGLLVESSSFQGSALAGLYCRDVTDLSVIGCFFENNNRGDAGYGALHLEEVSGQPYDQEENVLNVVGGFFSPGSGGGPSSRGIYVENTDRVNVMGVDIRGSAFQYSIEVGTKVGAVNLIGNKFHGRPRNIPAFVEVNEIGSD